MKKVDPYSLAAALVAIAMALVLSGKALAGDSSVDRDRTIRLATTTSTENSGLLGDLLPRFTRDTGYDVHVIAVGTGKALRMGRDGDVDVLLVHAPSAEKKFVRDGFGEQRLPVMYNDFVIVGPAGDPAGIAQATDAGVALARIARSGELGDLLLDLEFDDRVDGRTRCHRLGHLDAELRLGIALQRCDQVGRGVCRRP